MDSPTQAEAAVDDSERKFLASLASICLARGHTNAGSASDGGNVLCLEWSIQKWGELLGSDVSTLHGPQDLSWMGSALYKVWGWGEQGYGWKGTMSHHHHTFGSGSAYQICKQYSVGELCSSPTCASWWWWVRPLRSLLSRMMKGEWGQRKIMEEVGWAREEGSRASSPKNVVF